MPVSYYFEITLCGVGKANSCPISTTLGVYLPFEPSSLQSLRRLQFHRINRQVLGAFWNEPWRDDSSLKLHLQTNWEKIACVRKVSLQLVVKSNEFVRCKLELWLVQLCRVNVKPFPILIRETHLAHYSRSALCANKEGEVKY